MFFFLMIRRPPRSTQSRSSAASDVYKRQPLQGGADSLIEDGHADDALPWPHEALALGGGGARGLAHIPMLEVFDELGVKPAIIAGCSMGALIGAAYACGMTAKEMRLQAEKILGNRMGAARYVFGTRGSKIRDIVSLQGLLSLHLQGEKLVELALPDTLSKNIEEAVIPLRIIATDFERMEERVLSQGSIIQAVAASIAIPGVIVGPRIEGHIHVDGGVTNPVPFNHVREGMDIVVAIDVTGKPKALARAHPSNMELAVGSMPVSYTHLRAHETVLDLVCRLLLAKKKH